MCIFMTMNNLILGHIFKETVPSPLTHLIHPQRIYLFVNLKLKKTF